MTQVDGPRSPHVHLAHELTQVLTQSKVAYVTLTGINCD